MVQQRENDVAATIRLSGIHLKTKPNLTMPLTIGTNDTQLNEIVERVVAELLDVAQTTPISHIVLTGTKRRQVLRLMSHHPTLANAMTLVAEPTENKQASHTIGAHPQTVYRINTDCYPFSKRFS